MKPLLALLLRLAGPAAQAQQAELTALIQKANVPGMRLVYTKGKAVTAYSVSVCLASTAQAVTAATIFRRPRWAR